MSSKRYAYEFKAEAVKQITERGYPASEVARRLGVSTHSLYAWLREAGVTRDSRQAGKQADLAAENARLRAELAASRKNATSLKRPRRTLPRRPGKVRFHSGSSQ